MQLRLTEEQERLRASAREMLERECPMRVVRASAETDGCVPAPLWKHMAELGWLGLPFGEAHGGSGLGAVELALLLEEMGRVLLPDPFFASTVLGGLAVELCGSEAQREAALPPLAQGATRGALAWLEPGGRWDVASLRLEAARESGGSLRLSGTKWFALGAAGADWAAVAVRDAASGEPALVRVDLRAPGVAVSPTALIDATRRAGALRLDGVRVGPDARLPGDAAALGRLLDWARVALAAEATGGAARVLELCVDYARTRRQFGQPIGSFQAIQHRCADLLVAVEAMRSATWMAAAALAHDLPEAHASACRAQAFCSDAYARVAGEGIQIHGGLGFTWEQDLHLFYRRAKLSQLLLGDATWHRELVARALLDG